VKKRWKKETDYNLVGETHSSGFSITFERKEKKKAEKMMVGNDL